MRFEVWMGLVTSGLLAVAMTPASVSLIRNTRGPLERAFVLRSVQGAWLSLALAAAVTCILPVPWAYGPIPLWMVLVPLLAYRMTYTQMLIRKLDSIRSGSMDQ